MEYYTPKKELIISTFTPIKDFRKEKFFCLMDANTNEVEAITGFHMQTDGTDESLEQYYLSAAKDIQQAKLYAHAPQLLELVKHVMKFENINYKIFQKLNIIVKDIQNIKEPANRLLGEGAFNSINRLSKKD